MKCNICKKDRNYFTELHIVKIYKCEDHPKVLVCWKCLGLEEPNNLTNK